jgi:hypothetical protein
MCRVTRPAAVTTGTAAELLLLLERRLLLLQRRQWQGQLLLLPWLSVQLLQRLGGSLLWGAAGGD